MDAVGFGYDTPKKYGLVLGINDQGRREAVNTSRVRYVESEPGSKNTTLYYRDKGGTQFYGDFTNVVLSMREATKYGAAYIELTPADKQYFLSQGIYPKYDRFYRREA